MIARFLRNADPYLKFFVVFGTAIYLLELSTEVKNTLHPHLFFVWAERFIAVVFTIEYLLRWLDDAHD